MVFVVQQDQRCGDDPAETPGAAAVAAQRLVCGLEQRVCPLTEASKGSVDGVISLLINSQLPALGFLERDLEDVGFAFVAEVGQAQLAITDPRGDQLQQIGVGAGGGGVVFTARAYVRGPQRPAVRGRDDLDVSAVVLVFPAPPQVHPGGRAGGCRSCRCR